MTRTRAALLLGGMFVLGLACGILGTAAYTMHRFHRGGFSHERMERFVVRRLTHRLDLDETQRKAVEEVVHTTRLRLEEVHAEVAPKIEAILDDAYRKILPSLTPEQQKKLEVIRAEARDRLHRRHSLEDHP
jgi:Spy/CpxP family protein refolding chaperone